MSGPLRLALIGAGSIANAQLTNLAGFADVAVVACADPDERALARAREVHGVTRGYRDWRELLEAEEVDAISVCTPNAHHAEPTIGALRRGLHVLVEKPMAVRTAEAVEMAEAARAAGVHLVVGFQFRFDPRTEAIRRRIEAGDLGRILHVRCRALRRRGIPNRGVFGRKELSGGGPLMDIGVHVLEMAHSLMGSPRPIAAAGATWTYLGDRPMAAACKWPDWDWKTHTVEDLAVGQIRFSDGSSLSIETSFAAHIADDEWNMHLLGSEGGATWDTATIHRDAGGAMWNEACAHPGERHVYAYKLRHFVDVCAGRCANRAPAEHGVMIQAMVEALYRSAAVGHEIRLDGLR
jgi:predicted dehydrogenase